MTRRKSMPQMARPGNTNARRREPDQWQNCTGPCERHLPPHKFHVTRYGTLCSWCEECVKAASKFSAEKYNRWRVGVRKRKPTQCEQMDEVIAQQLHDSPLR